MSTWGHVEVAHVSHLLPDGRTLLDDVSFRVGEGVTAALVGPNGAGKTTLLRMVAGDLAPPEGTVASSGGLGVMRQFIGTNQGTELTPMVRDLLLSVSPPRVREAAARLDAAELAMMEGTVLAVTHDRWFARSFERFLIFTADGRVREATEPSWD